MKSEGRVYDPSLPLADQSEHIIRLGPQGGTITQAVHGDHFLGTYNEHAFHSANQGATGQVTTVALATTYTGLCLSNPVGSEVLLVVNEVVAAFNIVFPAAAFIGIMAGYSATTDVTHTTPLTPRSDKIGQGPTPIGKADSAATLPVTPTVAHVMGHAVASEAGSYEHNYEGGLILPAGGFCCIYTSTVSGANGMLASIDWEEIRIK